MADRVGPRAEEDWAEGQSTDSDNAQWINIRSILKVIPRDNPNDPFKPSSVQAIHRLAESGGTVNKSQILLKSEEDMLQNYGADLDMCTPLDRTNPQGAKTSNISRESRAELLKLPSWLRSFIESRFDTIHDKYKHHTHIFLQMLANRTDYRRMKYWTLLSKNIEENTGYVTQAENHDDETEELMNHEYNKAFNERRDQIIVSLDPFRPPDNMVVEESGVDPDAWSPLLMQRAADALRAILLAGASESEGEGEETFADEDGSRAFTNKVARLRALRKDFVHNKEDEYVYKGPHWEDLVAEREFFQEKARFDVDMEYTPKDKRKEYYMKTCIPIKKDKAVANNKKSLGKEKLHKKKDKEKKNEKLKEVAKNSVEHEEQAIAEELAKQRHTELMMEGGDPNENEFGAGDDGGCIRRMKDYFGKKQYYSYNPGHPLYRHPKARVQRKARLFRDRGVGKRPSRIYFKDPCKGPIIKVARELHQPRRMEGFHAYINYIVGAAWFRYFIMGCILLNAVFLALETNEDASKDYDVLYDVFDSIFLSVYVAEFIIKLYANPVQYFRSGFNVFDFLILLISLMKNVVEWSSEADIGWLRYFIIIRALRVLRGVSLSIHIQVLVTALVETLKNHVLSVVILLLLLMYIASIIAFYFFIGEKLSQDWGQVPKGMLLLFTFVTMEGWTEVLKTFEEANQIHMGRTFCLICIVLGNFLFSNIFIAIIIMQISDATDSFRKSQTDERESSVFLKQEAVFRRQKLDMRQLLARQKMGVADDFYELGSKFVRRLRHDDLTDNHQIIFSPLWIDAFYKTMKRAHHTSNLLMNLHRKMSDRLVALNNLYNEGKYCTRGISRARYNRYIETKAKLRVLKELFVDMRNPPEKPPLKVKLPEDLKVTTKAHAGPPTRKQHQK